MGYGDKSKINIEDSVSIPSLPPAIYTNGRILEVRKDQAGKEGEEKKEVLVFIFSDKDGNLHQHTEWDQSEDQTKATNQLSRIGSYVRQVVENYQFPDTLDSWDDVRDEVVKQMANCKDVEVDFKVVANVYNPQKARPQLPNYKGAVVASSKKTKLSFSTSELSDLATYQKILAGTFSSNLPLSQEDSLLPGESLLGGSSAPEDIF